MKDIPTVNMIKFLKDGVLVDLYHHITKEILQPIKGLYLDRIIEEFKIRKLLRPRRLQ